LGKGEFKVKRTIVAGPLVAASVALLTSCAGTSEADSLKEVDTLVSRIERVHVESELAKQRVREAVDLLHFIVGPEFSGDPVLAYGDFVAAVERSEEQETVLRSSVSSMKASATSVFSSWSEGLAVFANPNMRARSEERLRETRERYGAITASADPALDSMETLNASLRDHVLFLEHDFNPYAVAALGGEVGSVTEHASRLDANLDVCLAATLAYVQSTALPGELVVSQGPAEPEPVQEEAPAVLSR